MTGISKHFFKFSSLLAVVAMFLGLMVTGCSEGDSTPAHVDFDADSATLDMIVGLADPAAKGFDCDSSATIFTLRMFDADNNTIGGSTNYTEQASENTLAWTVLDDGALLMSIDVAPENVDKVAAIAIAVHDKDANLLGLYAEDDVTLTAGAKTTVDFTAEDAPAFMTAADALANTTLTLNTVPEAVDGVVSIAVDEQVTVSAIANMALTEKLIIKDEIPAEGLVLTTTSTDIKINDVDNTVKGVNATTENAIVTATVSEGTVDFNAELAIAVIGE